MVSLQLHGKRKAADTDAMPVPAAYRLIFESFCFRIALVPFPYDLLDAELIQIL